MPGALPHLIAGCAMYITGRYYFRSYFDGDDKVKERLLLLFICLSFSILPDFFLIIYYTTYIFPIEVFLPYHDFVFLISSPLAIVALLILKYVVDIETKPVWIMGMWCILLHISMDLFLPHNTVWIWI